MYSSANGFGFWWALLLATLPIGRSTDLLAGPTKDDQQTFQLIVDYGDGVQKHFTQLEWRPEMTVLDAMQAARQHPRGIQFEYRGQGGTAFLYSLDRLANGFQGKSWLFRVNGELAMRSFGVQKINAGDTVLWRFEVYR